jgi:hypothetical protein
MRFEAGEIRKRNRLLLLVGVGKTLGGQREHTAVSPSERGQ